MFSSEPGRESFAKIMMVSLAGMLLPWFRLDRGPYLWGFYGFPFVMIQGLLIAVFCSKAMEEKRRGIIFPMVTELLLISFPIIYFCLMMSWNTPFVISQDCFSEGGYTALPTFWIAFALAFIPIFAFPFLRRRKKDRVESNVRKKRDRMFASEWGRKTFARIVLLSWAGLFLPWFSFYPDMQGYVWGFLFFPYFMLQMAVLVVCYHNEPKDELGVFIVSIITELCLITFPVVYFWQMMVWYYPITFKEYSLAKGLSATYPTFWIAFALTFMPIFALPILRRWGKG